jgi:hypothetical protein
LWFASSDWGSDYANGTWHLKSLQQLLTDVNGSIHTYGYVMVVVHPQELMTGNKMNNSEVTIIQDFMVKLSDYYSYTTIQKISKTLTLPHISKK